MSCPLNIRLGGLNRFGLARFPHRLSPTILAAICGLHGNYLALLVARKLKPLRRRKEGDRRGWDKAMSQGKGAML